MITITFDNPNSRSITSIDIYRSEGDTVIPDTPTDAPIVTLDGFATTWTDRTTQVGINYNYRVRVYRTGGESVISDTVTYGDQSLYGPGEYLAPVGQGNTTWLLEQQVESDQLPTQETLLAYFGGAAENVLGWTGKWTKIKEADTIYYMPYKAYFQIPFDKLSTLMTNIAALTPFSVGYCNYDFQLTQLSAAGIVRMLDGCYPSIFPIVTEYPKININRVCSQLSGLDAKGINCLLKIASATSALVTANQTGNTGSASNVYNTTVSFTSQSNWFWKPIIRFRPQDAGKIT